jgi:GNAT superfamily N-acetyltransferase
VTGHEGRHRCITAKKLGIEKVPVLIYTGSCFDRVPNWDKNTHDIVDKADFLPQINENSVDIVAGLEKQLQNKYRKFLDELMFYYDEFSKGIFITDIYIKKEFRGSGYGSQIMKEIVNFADKNKMPISLIPVSDDAPRHKLIKFYKQFGFIENNGNTLFDDMSMYRLPKH